MPRETALFDVLVPTLFLAFLASILIHAGMDWLLARCGVYRRVWHSPLFRLCIFICIFCICGLLVLR